MGLNRVPNKGCFKSYPELNSTLSYYLSHSEQWELYEIDWRWDAGIYEYGSYNYYDYAYYKTLDLQKIKDKVKSIIQAGEKFWNSSKIKRFFKKVTSGTSSFKEIQAAAEDYDNIFYNSEFSDTLDDTYLTALSKLQDKYPQANIELDPSIQAGVGQITLMSNKGDISWNYKDECDELTQELLDSRSMRDFEKRVFIFLENKFKQIKQDLSDTDDLDESKNPLKDAEEFAKKHQKGLGAFVKLNAGNVEKGMETFNKNMGDVEFNASSEGTGLGESAIISEKTWKKKIDKNLAFKLRDAIDNNDKASIAEAFKDIVAYIGKAYPDLVEDDYYYNDLVDDVEVLDFKDDDDQFDYVLSRLYDFLDDNDIWLPIRSLDEDEEDSMNIREELNKIDMDTCETDLVNMYECCNLSTDEKINIVNLIKEQKIEELVSFFDTKINTNLIEDFYEEPFSEADLKAFANMIKVNAPASRGEPYPAFKETRINESEIPDNMRYKMWDADVIDNKTIELTWLTQEEFTPADSEIFIEEIKRAINALIDSSRFDQPFTIALEARSRSGYEDGHLAIDLDFNRD